MDGTLIVPAINFAEMRRRVGVPPGRDILDYLRELEGEAARAAHAAIHDVEHQAMLNMRVMPGARELAHFLDDRHIPRALVTRNMSASVDHFHSHHFELAPFAPALTREFMPYKVRACRERGVDVFVLLAAALLKEPGFRARTRAE